MSSNADPTEPVILDPYAVGLDTLDEPDLSRDLSSDPEFDFAAHGWTWDGETVVPPA